MPHLRRGSTTFSVAHWYGGGWDSELPPLPRDEPWCSPHDERREP